MDGNNCVVTTCRHKQRTQTTMDGKLKAKGKSYPLLKGTTTCHDAKVQVLVSRQPNDAGAQGFNISYSELAKATQNFSSAMRIGGGGSCEVFRGVILTQRAEVAVKVLKQGQHKATDETSSPNTTLNSEAKQFFAEMRLLQAVQHPNICPLLAVSLDGPYRW